MVGMDKPLESCHSQTRAASCTTTVNAPWSATPMRRKIVPYSRLGLCCAYTKVDLRCCERDATIVADASGYSRRNGYIMASHATRGCHCIVDAPRSRSRPGLWDFMCSGYGCAACLVSCSWSKDALHVQKQTWLYVHERPIAFTDRVVKGDWGAIPHLPSLGGL
jgi:hypothetical protein